MSAKRDLPGLKNRQVLVLVAGAAVAGFLLAAVLYGRPWHQSPDWGDLATWMTALVGALAAWFVLGQLQQQQAVIEDEQERGRRRDELLDGQLRELADREWSRQREQAELVYLDWAMVTLPVSTENRASDRTEREGSIRIENKSGRPMRQVACRMYLDDREFVATSFGRGVSPGLLGPGPMFLPAKDDEVDLPAGTYLDLFAEETIRAAFAIPDDVDSYQKSNFLIRFTDDAARRWELNDRMHLERAPHDASW